MAKKYKPTPAEILLSEADWLDTAAANAEKLGNNPQFMEGFKTAARWIRFHGDHPFLLDGRKYGKEN